MSIIGIVQDVGRYTLKGLKKVSLKTPIGERIKDGLTIGEFSTAVKFTGAPSPNEGLLKMYGKSIVDNGLTIASRFKEDASFQKTLMRYAEKNKLFSMDLLKVKSEEDLLQMVLQKSGVGPCKFAQIISSDKEMMSKFSPKMQEIIKKTQSENPFSRTLDEAQEVVNKAFGNPNDKMIGNATINYAMPVLKSDMAGNVKLIKPLSAGTVGEAYLAKTSDGKEVIVKMIKKNVDREQLDLEEKIFSHIIGEISPDKNVAQKQIKMFKQLYKDWGKELNFTEEYNYNKLLQQGAKRYKVADIKSISKDKSCIIMDKAEGIQMNNLLKILKDYKSNPGDFATKYAKEIEENPWLANPQKVISELPDTITKSFDEMLLFVKKDGKSVMHGDPHMGNYFISQNAKGELMPVFIDTGNCVIRDCNQIQDDLKFMTNYFVGNSKGVTKYFMRQCERDVNKVQKCFGSNDIVEISTANKFVDEDAKSVKKVLSDKEMEEKISEDIDKLIFSKRQNVTDIENVEKTIQTILDKYGLTMKPESSTALKAQLQFYTGITEAAALDGKTMNVGTIVKDVPQALQCMLKNRMNPIKSIQEALRYAYKHQTNSTSIMYQFFHTPEIELLFNQGCQSKEAGAMILAPEVGNRLKTFY